MRRYCSWLGVGRRFAVLSCRAPIRLAPDRRASRIFPGRSHTVPHRMARTRGRRISESVSSLRVGAHLAALLFVAAAVCPARAEDRDARFASKVNFEGITPESVKQL